MRVLVTGGAGFIGSHIVEARLAKGDGVVVLDNLSSGFAENLPKHPKLSLAKGDVRQPADVQKAFAGGVDLVYHLAEYIPNTAGYGAGHVVKYSTENPLDDFRTSAEGTLHVLEEARKKDARVALMSTAAVYGKWEGRPFQEDDLPKPISPYGASKLSAEAYTLTYHRTYGLPAFAFRMFNCYGPRQRKYLMFELALKMLRDPKAKIPLTPESERDYIYVNDAVRAFELVLASKGPEGQVFNICNGEAVKTKLVADLMAQRAGAQPQFEMAESLWKGEISRLVGDNSKLRALGYAPQCSLEKGLDEVIAWARKEPQ